MSVEPLFYEVGPDFGFVKLSEERGFKLPDDDSKWPQSITDHVASDVPHLGKYPIEVYLDEKDPKKGYAKGRIMVSEKVIIPLIIRDFRLSPLDVFINEGEFTPLSEKNLDAILMKKGLAAEAVSKEESRGETGQLQEGNRPPYSAYTHRNQGYKMSSALDGISSVALEDVDKFKMILESDPILSYKFATKTAGIISRLEKKAELPEPKLRGLEMIKKASEDEGWECDVMQISKTASNKFIMYTSSDKCPMAFNEQELTWKEASSIIGPKGMQKIAAGEPYTFVRGRGRMQTNLPKELSFPTEELEKFGHYDVITKNNNIVRGFLLPEVYDFSMRKVSGMKLFVNPNIHSMQEKIAGRKVMAGPASALPSHTIQEGTTGTFCFRYGEKTAATTPFHVSSFPLISGEQIEFEAISDKGDPIHMTILPGLAAAAPGEKRGHYLIPSLWQFVRVGSYNEPLMESSEEMLKTALADTDHKKLEVVWDGVYYQFLGPQVENISQQVQDLDAMKARFLLTAFGIPADYADKVLKSAKENGHFDVRVDIKPVGQYAVETNSAEHRDGSKDTKYANAGASTAASIKGDVPWIKLAAEMGDKETVDSVLALNFINKNNMNEFVDAIDNFKDTQTKLAKLLVASRLGIKQMAPDTVKMAMEHLGDVIDDLEVLRSVSSSKRK